MRDTGDIEDKINRFGDTVWRACLLYFRAGPDAEDAFQDTFFAYACEQRVFTDDEHTKAWLIRVATNTCKDMLRAASRKNIELDGALENSLAAPISSDEQPGSLYQEIVDAMRALDDPPRTPLYLAVYEGYTAPEIAEMLGTPVNTIYSWISRGKAQLREVLS